jgi:anaerobic ribonucleoside-triphosphate reductase activating protein
MTTLLLSRAHYPVTVLGPGTRAGIWTQGCTIRCPGCLSRDTWPADAATAVPVAAVLGWLAALPAVDGVTISGGEPFQQPRALRELLYGIADWRADRSIDILVYSGYAYSRLRRSAWSRELLEMCDAVVAGPYLARRAATADRRAPAPRGSANQRLVPLSPLGRRRYARDDANSAHHAGNADDASSTDNAAVDSSSCPTPTDPADSAGSADSPRIQVCFEQNRIYYIGIPRPGDMNRLTERLVRAGIDPGKVSWHP